MKIRGLLLVLGLFCLPGAAWTQEPSSANKAGIERILESARKVRATLICSDGKRASEKGPRDAADLTAVQEGVAAGVWHCERLMGGWLERGEGMATDLPRARQLYQQVAEKSPAGFVALGRLAEKGLGQPASPAEALALYRKAADADDGDGHVEVGRMLENGLASPKDPAAAAAEYRKAAARGNDAAWGNLDRMQSATPMFSELEIAADRKLWVGLLVRRIRSRIESAAELKPFTEMRKATVKLLFRRGAEHPATSVTVSSNDAAYDAAIVVVMQSLTMPPAPIYSATGDDYPVEFPIAYRNDAKEPPKTPAR